ncbi:ABC transporter substrate-binding protein [Microtetraspora fusca]|uniref:ABC transporter substrate-binding protein n=1 Tax=Microtetraspora fusca TaxID=1997 RepID=UPI001FE190AE|nr:ABC transporter substrate-binding protein [Microtetraspora fusca]
MLGLTTAALGMPALLTGCGGAAAPAGSASAPGRLRWVLGQNVPTLDVAKSAGAPIPLLALSHETLVRLDKDLSIVPVLAESWEQPTPTKLVYSLRQGVTFWDGTPLTAEDIAFSITRHLDPKVGSPIASLLSNYKAVEVTSPTELTITLSRPDPAAKYLTARCAVTPKAYSERLGDQLGMSGPEVKTIGTGPYLIKRFDSAAGIEYEANPSYWGAKPRYGSIAIDFVADANARQLAVRSGKVAGTMDVPVVAIQDWRRLPKTSIMSSPPLMSAFLALNVNRAPFDDIHVRRALAHAVDRDGFVKAFLHGDGAPARAVPPPAQWANLADEATVRRVYDSLPAYDFDLAKAKAELAKSKHAGGFSATVRFPDANPHLGKALVSLAQTVRTLGIQLTVQEAPMTDWRSQLMDHQHEMNIMILRPNYPDPADFLNLLLPSNAAAKGQYNIAEYRSTEVDELMAAQAAVEGERRVDAMATLLARVNEDLPYIPLWWEASSMALSDDFSYDGYSTLYYDQEWADNVRPRA